MAGKQSEISPSGETVAQNIQRLREYQRVTFAELSRRLDEIGRAIPPLGLRRIEAGQRRVDVDDLIALAIALKSTPATLLTPNAESSEQQTDATGLRKIQVKTLWQWVTASAPVEGKHSDATSYLEWTTTALPRWRQIEVAEGALDLLELRRAELDVENGDRQRLDAILKKHWRSDGDD
ncbi:helix-turn-helix domain-containing protein [Gordonia sihwensis]|uniref:helix-turn-helix domain-containing protein n=1 Tax=Gordonia sihwensis TaxID=173559 RepID=UPI001C92F5C3|nr:helix-turn-helix transcriptional regulator [Gordonia sihwensis]